jgi:hypothetical protein
MKHKVPARHLQPPPTSGRTLLLEELPLQGDLQQTPENRPEVPPEHEASNPRMKKSPE